MILDVTGPSALLITPIDPGAAHCTNTSAPMHSLRIQLHNELHARPSIYFDGPASVYHVAFLVGGGECNSLLDRLVGSGTQSPHGFVEREGARFKWERHGEFLTITSVVSIPEPGEPWPSFPPILSELMAAYASQVISATQLAVTIASENHDLSLYGFQDPAGSLIGGQGAELWSDFVLSDDGVCRVLMVNRSLNTYRLGRMVRRVLEQETYRMIALLGLPDAQRLADQLERFEKVLSDLTERTAKLDRGETRGLLDDIAALSTDTFIFTDFRTPGRRAGMARLIRSTHGKKI